MRARKILGMQIVDQKQIVPAHLVHGDEIVNGFLKSAKRLVVIQISNMLAHKSLAIDYEGD